MTPAPGQAALGKLTPAFREISDTFERDQLFKRCLCLVGVLLLSNADSN